MRGGGRFIGCAALAFACFPSTTTASASPVTERALDQSPAEVREYWTPERMANAKPLDLAPAEALPDVTDLRDLVPAGERRSVPSNYAAVQIDDTTPPGIRTHGKIFGAIPGFGGFVCSGAVVTAPNESTVWTAAHCIYDTDEDLFATNLLFVPAYDVGAKPFGEWAALDAFVTDFWITSGGDSRDDVGAMRMEVKQRAKTAAEKRKCNRKKTKRKRRRCKRKKVNEPIQDKVGARGIAFNQDETAQTYNAFGYPVNPQPRFDGQHLERCTSGLTFYDGSFPEPRPIGISCDQQGGASGGGWVISGGRVNGNVSYGYPNVDPNTFFSPYFDEVIQGFYNSVRSE
jgi:hypothetical protein